jgi:hypothetical protein
MAVWALFRVVEVVLGEGAVTVAGGVALAENGADTTTMVAVLALMVTVVVAVRRSMATVVVVVLLLMARVLASMVQRAPMLAVALASTLLVGKEHLRLEKPAVQPVTHGRLETGNTPIWSLEVNLVSSIEV